MYYLDRRWRRQSLVYFEAPQVSSANVAGGAFRDAALALFQDSELTTARRAPQESTQIGFSLPPRA